MQFLIWAVALLWTVSVVAAVPATANTSLTLSEAIALMLENNPQLQVADFDNRAAAARIRQQTRTTPWHVGMELEDFAGTGIREGVDTLQTTISLGRVFELGNKPELRGEVAQAQAALLNNEQDAKRLDLMAETTRRFLDLAHAQEKMVLAKESVTIKQRNLAVVRKRSKIGKAANADLNRAKIDLARAELGMEAAEHLITNTRHSLARMWGDLDADIDQVIADLYRLEAVPDIASLDVLIEKNPSLVKFATQQRLAEARIRLASAANQPNLEMSGGIRHYNLLDDLGLVFSVKVPLGSQSRARAARDEAVALSEREPLLMKDKKLALRSTLMGLHQELTHDRHVVESMQQSIIPAARSMLKDYNTGYAAGRYSLLELTQAEDVLLNARLEALNAAADYQRNRTEIDRLAGAALSHLPDLGVNP